MQEERQLILVRLLGALRVALAGAVEGVQFLDIGGASERGVLTVEKLQSFFTGGIPSPTL